MRKVSIALRRLGANEFPSLTNAELRALKRETEPWSEDLDLFLADMQEVDQESPEEQGQPDSNGEAELSPESTLHPVESVSSEHEVVSSEPEVSPAPLDESGQVTLYSRREAQDGFSVTFKLKGDSDQPNDGELTVYSHSSEAQLSGLGDSPDSAFAVAVPASSSIRLGPDRSSTGWDSLMLKGPGAPDDEPSEEPVPRVPVPDEVPGSLWAVPVELFANTQNGLALTNASDQPVVVHLYLLDKKGNRLAGTLDPKLNPLLPNRQVLEPVDRYFPEILGFAEFYGTVVVRVEREGQIWAMGVIGNEPESQTIRRALNMNVDLEGLKSKMAKELEAIAAREATLQEQMSHLDAVLSLASGNGDGLTSTQEGSFSQSPPERSENEFSEASGS